MKLRQIAGCQTLHCPAVYEVLADEACVGGGCPTVLQDGTDYVIVGATVSPDEPALSGKVGPGESVVRISAELVRNAIAAAKE